MSDLSGPDLADQTRAPQTAQPGVMHSVDQAFYDLTVKQRDAAWRECEQLWVKLAEAAERIEAGKKLAASLGGPIGQRIEFALKHGQLQSDLKCEDCSAGGHYHCARGQSSYPRCCCPERLDLNQ